MGLISWIKDKYNESRFQGAIASIKSGNTTEGENILRDILNKHPQAIVELAKLYHKQASALNDARALKEYSKVFDLELSIDSAYSYDKTSYRNERDVVILEIEDRADSFFCSGDYETSLRFLDSISTFRKSFTDYVAKFNHYKLFSYLNQAYQEKSSSSAIQKLSLPLQNIPDTIKDYQTEVIKFCKEKADSNAYYSRTIKFISTLYPSVRFEESLLVSYYVKCALGKDADKISVLPLSGLLSSDELPHFYAEVTEVCRKKVDTAPKGVFTICRQYIDTYFGCSDVYFAACSKMLSNKQNFPESEVLLNLKKITSLQRLLDVCKNFVSLASFSSLYHEKLVEFIAETLKNSGAESALNALDCYWLNGNSKNIFVDLLSIDELKVKLILHLIKNSDRFVNDEVLNTILTALSHINDSSFVLDNLEVLLSKNFAVGAIYEDHIVAASDALEFNQKLGILDRGLSHYNSRRLLTKKLDLAPLYASNDDLTTALQIFDNVASIISVDSQKKDEILDIYYGKTKSLILDKFDANDLSGALSCLDSRWVESSPKNIFQDLLVNESFRDSLLSHIIENSSRYIFSNDVLDSICNVIVQEYSCEKALDMFERLNSLGFDVRDYYIKKVQTELSTLAVEDRESLLNRSLAIYNVKSLLLEKSFLLWQYVDLARYNDALRIGDSLRNVLPSVDCDICFVLIELSKSVESGQEKLSYLDKAESKWSELKWNIKGRYGKVQLRKFLNSASFACADVFESEKNIDGAVSLVSRIIAHDRTAINVLARILCNDLVHSESDAVKLETQCLLIKRALGKLHELGISELQEDDNFIKMWNCLVDSIILLHKNSDVNSAYEQELCQTWINFESCNLSVKADHVRTHLQDTILEVKKTFATGFEASGAYSDAISKYDEMSNFLKSPIWHTLRICICSLKSRNHSLISRYEDTINNCISNPNSDYSSELYELTYRYCILLLKRKDNTKALELIKKYLPNESDLLSVCENQFILAEESLLHIFNDKISAVQNGTMSSKDAKAFLRSIEADVQSFKHITTVSTTEVVNLKNQLKEYIIYKLYNEGNFVDCFRALKTLHGDYIGNKTSMRNLAIVCLAIAENNLITDSNYKEVIAIWLTSIYDERIFVESLKQTSWDDQYTFTLYNALGNYSSNNYGLVPSNVNFDEPNGGNQVEIRGVQTKLMSRFELAIMNSQLYFSYYQSQKNAMDALIALELDIRCRAYAPGLLKYNTDAKKEVKDALDTEEQHHYYNWESVLKSACAYGFNNGIYADYQIAMGYVEKCKSALASNNINSIKSSFGSDKVDAIKEFEGLTDELSSAVQSKFSEARSSMSIDRVVSFFLPIAKSLSDENFNFALANFVKNEVIGKVNDKELSLSEGSKLMTEVYVLCPSHRQVKDNLSKMIEALVTNFITEGDSSDVTALKSILKSTRDFDSSVVSALQGDGSVPAALLLMLFAAHESNFNQLKSALSSFSSTISRAFSGVSSKMADVQVNIKLSEIIDKVNKGSMSKKDALSQLYDLYITHSDHARLCENLAIISKLCIMEYIAEDKVGKQQVKQILDRLRGNRSYTFNSHNSDISDTRRQIMSGMSPQNRDVIMNHPAMLNDKGKALKLALDYLQYLS